MNNTPVLILLCGGKSTRMGSPKGLLDYHGLPWVLEQISRYSYVKNPIVYVGLGYDNKLYLEAIPWFKNAVDKSFVYAGVEVKVIINHQPQLGPFSTLQTVLNVVDAKTSVIVHPIDVPFLGKEDLVTIINKNNVIVIPTCDTKNGHPVKLKPEFWMTLLTKDVSNSESRLDTQIKKYLSSSISYVNVEDTSIYQNINTKEKWNNYIENSY